MEKREIETLIEFNFWANNRILESCERLSFMELNQPLKPDPGWGYLLGILVHILDSEYGWRSVLQSQPAAEILNTDDFRAMESLKSRWTLEQTGWLEFVASLSDETFKHPFRADPEDGMSIWQTILHVVTHGIQHRSEAAAILTGYGHSPGELDFDVFLKEQGN
jgi:uncharacterized damage-inducible protein DinB